MKKTLIIGLVFLLLLIVAGVVVAPILFASWITPDALVRQIESSLNCRASIESVDVKIFRRPSQIIMRGLALGPRDSYAIGKVPLASREPMQEMATHCDSVELEMRLGSLATRRIDIERFVISSLNVRMTLKEDGTNSLLPLFDKPGAIESQSPGGAPKPPSEPFSSKDLPVSMIADVIELDGGSIYATIEENGSTILVDDVQFRISEIDIDPGNLAEHNRGVIELAMLVGVDSPPEKGERYAEFRFDGDGILNLFDPTTGQLDPALVADLTIAEGSYIDANPTLEAVAGMLKELKRFGIKIDDVDLSGDFKEPVETQLEYAKGILRVLKETHFNVGDYSLVLAPESWLDANTNQHDFQGSVIASEETTAEAIAEVDEWLKEEAKSFASTGVRDMLLAPVMHEGRIRLGFRSSGAIDEPKVDLLTRIGTLSNVLKLGDADSLEALKTQGKELLKGLKNMFRRPEPEPAQEPPANPDQPLEAGGAQKTPSPVPQGTSGSSQ